jgi:hypothetical protein
LYKKDKQLTNQTEKKNSEKICMQKQAQQNKAKQKFNKLRGLMVGGFKGILTQFVPYFNVYVVVKDFIFKLQILK